MMILFTRRAVDQQCKMTKIDVVQPRRDGQVEVRKGNQIRLLTGWAKGIFTLAGDELQPRIGTADHWAKFMCSKRHGQVGGFIQNKN